MRGRIFGPDGQVAVTEDRDFSVLSSSQTDMIFISHRRTDLREAEAVAECIATYGLRAYLDENDPEINGDRPGLIDYLLEVIRKTSGLIVVASAKTAGSWWVPGEVFAAHGNGRLLGTYRLDSVSLEKLPSYLRYDWPIMDSHDGLRTWCKKFRDARTYGRTPFLLEALKREDIDPADFYGSFVDGEGGVRISRLG